MRPTVSTCGCNAHGPPVPWDPLQARPLEGSRGQPAPAAGPPVPGWGCTLSHKSLAGVQQDLAAFDDHSLDGKVFPDVLCLAHFVVHYPAGTGIGWAGGGDAKSLARPSEKAWPGACSHESRAPCAAPLQAGMVTSSSGNPRKQVSSFPGKRNGGLQ